MEDFLKDQKKKLACVKEKFKVVLGNEACDLDSVISALTFAYFLYKVNKSTGAIIPILNVEREDLHLRTEVTFFLKKMNIPLENLVCKDEINLLGLKEENLLDLILVDHNSLSDEQTNLQDCISQIIDHHKINDPEQVNRCESNIEAVGSCCTLIAEKILDYPHLMNKQIAMLLYGTILLDTVCLQESAKRAREKDRYIVSKLETILVGINRRDVFDEISEAKYDISGLTPKQLIKKDIKYFSYKSTAVAIASLPVLLLELIEQESFHYALSQLSSLKKLDFIIILGSQINKDASSIRRHMAVYCECESTLEKVSKYLFDLENPSLELHPLPSNNKFIYLFDQENATLSRKFVMPAVQQYLKSSHAL